MSTTAGERKSSRTVKKPDFFVPPVNAVVSRQASDGSDSDSDADTPNRSTKRTNKGKGSNTEKGNDSDDDGVARVKSTKKGQMKPITIKINSGSILDKVIHGRWSAVEDAKLVEDLKDHRVAAMAGLFNFVLKCAGAEAETQPETTKKSKKNPDIGVIPDDVDLDGLDNEELSELLSNAIHEMDEATTTSKYSYALLSATKQTKHLRDLYRNFWEGLGDELRGRGDEDKYSHGLDTLHLIVEILTSLSSLFVSSIRDAAVEAVLCLSRSIRRGCVECKARITTCQRQITNEKGRQSARYNALTKNKSRLDKTHKTLMDMNNSVYQTVLLHRYRDVADSIRRCCAFHFGEWICIDAAETIKDEYLKYVGWMCSERCDEVRREAICSLSKIIERCGDYVGKLKHFVERFLPRFIDIATADVNDDVQYEMMQVLRTLQRKGFLDHISEEILDKLDDVVFDPDMCLRVRRECMMFVMDHTEGFDFVEDVKGKNKNKESESVATRRRNALLLESITEFVEHHLIGAGDESLSDDGAGSEEEQYKEIMLMTGLITEVCSTLPQGVIFRDWQTMFSMLLRDNISGRDNSNLILVSPLTEMQSTILIHLFVSNAILVTKIHNNGLEELQVGHDHVKYADDILHHSCHSNLMHAIGGQDFMKLLIRYKEDYYNSSVLIMVIECICIDSITVKSLQSLSSFVIDAFDSLTVTPSVDDAQPLSVQHTVLRRYVYLFSQWNKKYIDKNSSLSLAALSIDTVSSTPNPLAGALSKLNNVIETQLSSLFTRYWGIVSDGEVIENIRMALHNEQESSKAKTSKKSKKRNSIKEGSAIDLIHSYYNSVIKFTLLLKNMDCMNESSLKLFDVEDIETSMLPRLQANINSFVGFGHELCRDVNASAYADAINYCMEISKSTCDILFTITLWRLRQVYADTLSLKVNKKQKQSAKKIREDSEKVPKIEQGIELVCILRNHIVNEFYTPWMQLEDQQEDTETEGRELNNLFVSYQSGLRRYAFRMMGELRLLYPNKLMKDSSIPVPTSDESNGIALDEGSMENYVGTYAYVNKLVYAPSQNTLQAMKYVFEVEREYVDVLLNNELSELNDADANDEGISSRASSAALRTATHNLLHDLLLPLGKPLLFDMEHLNRRQASAIVPYLTSYSVNGTDVTGIQTIVIAWLNKLKSSDVIKFLEIQLVALKSFYATNIVELIQAQEQAEELDQREEEVDYELNIQENYVQLNELAYKLANTISTTKLTVNNHPVTGNVNLINGLESFVKASVDYAFSSFFHLIGEEEVNEALLHATLGFFDMVDRYIYLLPNERIKHVLDHISLKLNEVVSEDSNITFGDMLEDAIEKSDPAVAKPNRELACYIDFKRKMNRKKLNSAVANTKSSLSKQNLKLHVPKNLNSHLNAQVQQASSVNKSKVRPNVKRPVAIVEESEDDSDSEAETDKIPNTASSKSAASAASTDSIGRSSKHVALGMQLEDIPDSQEDPDSYAEYTSSSSQRSTRRTRSQVGSNKRSRSMDSNPGKSQSKGVAVVESDDDDALFSDLPETGTRKRYR